MRLKSPQRRRLLKLVSSIPTLAMAPELGAVDSLIIKKIIPTTGETINAIGMGTWITFNVGANPKARDERTKVLNTFLKLGGGMVDSSPMYGSAESVLGYALKRLGQPQPSLFSATKVWTSGNGQKQIEESFKLWNLKQFDLLQVHNLENWEEHLPYLLELKMQGKIRYVGITTSHGRRHLEMEKLILSQPLDFIQLTYNVMDQKAEKRLLPAAQEKGVAVIANRPFKGGDLFRYFTHKPLPKTAQEIGCNNWAQYFLKFVISHPAITCAIPATSKVEHMHENMGAMRGELPTQRQRKTMLDEISRL